MSATPARTRYVPALLLAMPALVWTADLLAGTPPVIIAAAIAPAAVFAAAIVAAQRGSGRRLGLLALSLAWGALVAAFLATNGNELARRWIPESAADDALDVLTTLVGPAIEEIAKALGLVLLFRFARGHLGDARDGIVHGALVGVGFVFTENLLYLGLAMLQGGEAGLARALFLRGVLGGATHMVFTGSVGAALGWSATSGRRGTLASRFAPALGFAFALIQHIAWNALAAPLIRDALCGAEIAGGACRSVPANAALFGEASLITLAFLAPGITLMWVAWRGSRTSQ